MPRPINLSLELLQTFLTLVNQDGDAAQAAKLLQVNQPSMSKRLRYLQHAGLVLEHPWLVRVGKTWRLTDEGQKVLPAVREIIGRYKQLNEFISAPEAEKTQLRFACGQQAVTGFVRHAVHLFRRSHPLVRLRVSTARGSARIEGVANGSLDLATVTHDDAAILETARRNLHIQPIRTDRLVLICSEEASWAQQVRKLPKNKVPVHTLADFPLIVPEADAGIRKGLDHVFRERALLDRLDIALEIGGWNAIVTYVKEGDGVGIVSEAALDGEHDLILRHLDPELFPPIVTKVICRRQLGSGVDLDLTPDANDFREALVKAARKRGE